MNSSSSQGLVLRTAARTPNVYALDHTDGDPHREHSIPENTESDRHTFWLFVRMFFTRRVNH